MVKSRVWYDMQREVDSPQSHALRIRAMGLHEPMTPGFIRRPQGTNDFLLMHFDAPVQIAVNGGLQDFPAPAFVIWPPDAGHHYGNREREWTHSWLHCYGAAAAEIAGLSGLSFGEPVVMPDSSLAERYLLEIYNEVSRYGCAEPRILAGYLTIWMREIARRRHSESDRDKGLSRLLAVKRHIEANLAQPIELVELAGIANLSVGHFSSEFRSFFGISPIEYVLRLRLQQAEYSLHDVSLSVSQIAYRVGFRDPLYFSKQFKKRYGLSPNRYRDTLLGQPE